MRLFESWKLESSLKGQQQSSSANGERKSELDRDRLGMAGVNTVVDSYTCPSEARGASPSGTRKPRPTVCGNQTQRILVPPGAAQDNPSELVLEIRYVESLSAYNSTLTLYVRDRRHVFIGLLFAFFISFVLRGRYDPVPTRTGSCHSL